MLMSLLQTGYSLIIHTIGLSNQASYHALLLTAFTVTHLASMWCVCQLIFKHMYAFIFKLFVLKWISKRSF